ncbi:MAG: hypothetical protein KOO66_08080 [Bacteroidales bacterium]|nr:hypothetical protein [Bacteroidales bacterium]
MKKILKLMLVTILGALLFSSCEEGETSMPDMGPGAVKNLISLGDPLILVDNPGVFAGSFTVDVIADEAAGSIALSVVFTKASTGVPDTAFVTSITSFPTEYNFDTQDLADLFPLESNYILNSLEGGDAFTFITGNIFMADGTEIVTETEYMVEAISETTGNDTIVAMDIDSFSPALANIQNGVWLQELTYYVGCPFDAAEAAGTYEIVYESWWEESYGPSLTGLTIEVLAGPGSDQITLIDPFKFDEYYGSGPYAIVVTVPADGFIFADVDGGQNICHFDASAPPYNWGYGPGFVEGGGLVLSCIGKIELRWELTVAAGSFGTFSYNLQKL